MKAWAKKYKLTYQTHPNLPTDPKWFKDAVPVVPGSTTMRRDILNHFHDAPTAGHPGRDKTIQAVKRRYWWPGMNAWIEDYMKGCAPCQQSKNLTHQKHIPMYRIAPHPKANLFEEVAMDLITQLPRNGPHDAILMIVDHGCTRAALFLPCSTTITGEGIAELYLRNIYQWFGIPKKVITDRDPRFTSHFATALCQRLKMKQNISTAYHPQTDRLSERKNQWVEQFLRFVTTAQQDDWSDWLPIASLVHNSRTNATIKIAPLQALPGYLPQLMPEATPLSTNQRVENHGEEMTRRREQAQAALAKTAQGMPTTQFQTGDQVWLEAKHLALPYQAPKLAPKRHGPFMITKQVSPVAYKLDLPMGWTIHNVFHASLLTPYRETTTHGPNYTRPPPDLIAGEKEYEVENIVNHRFYGRQQALQYLVHWRGYPDADNSWEPADQVHAPVLVARYHRRNPLGEAQTYKNPSKQRKVSIRFTLLPTQQCPLPPSIAPSSPCLKHASTSSPTPTSPQKPARPSKSCRLRMPSSRTKSWTKSPTPHSRLSPPAQPMLSLLWKKITSQLSSQPPTELFPLPRTFPSTLERTSHSRHDPPSQPSHSPASLRPRPSRLPSPSPTLSRRTARTSPTRLSCMPRQSTASKTRFAPLQVPRRSPRMAMSRMTTLPPTSPSPTSKDDSTWPLTCEPAPDSPLTSSEPLASRTTAKSTCAPYMPPLDTPTEGRSQLCPPGSSNSSAPSLPTLTPSSRPPTPNLTGDWRRQPPPL
jgi:hypothetical protein